jgi:hypothetical protein
VPSASVLVVSRPPRLLCRRSSRPRLYIIFDRSPRR